MKLSARIFIIAVAIPALAALGGGFAVFAEYDDAPGGILLGFLLILTAVTLSIKISRRA